VTQSEVIYLDNNSTTPVDPAVVEAMLPYFASKFGNPSNPAHDYGLEALRAVEHARFQVASLIGGESKEIVFTSGATESNNLAVLGAARGSRGRGNHVITTVIEHRAVLNPCRQLEREGMAVTYLPVDTRGRVSVDDLANAVTQGTVLVSVMAANNEVGTIQPIREIGRVCKERGILFHSDAVQALGKVPLNVEDFGVDLLSISGHKMYGPKGVGALFVRSRDPTVELEPIVHGGGQELGLRSGTVAVPGVVALGAACELAEGHLATESSRLRTLRNRLFELISIAIPAAIVHGPEANGLPGLLNLGFPGIDGDDLINCLKGVAVSQGSSCSARSFEPSYVLRALGIGDELARASIRIGVGRFTTASEVDEAAKRIIAAVQMLQHA